MSFYTKFCELAEQRGFSPSAAIERCGLSKGLLTKWKTKPDSVPNGETTKKICEYFKISADYFLDDASDLNIRGLENMPEISLLAKAGKNMTIEQRKHLLAYAEFMYPEAFTGIK